MKCPRCERKFNVTLDSSVSAGLLLSLGMRGREKLYRDLAETMEVIYEQTSSPPIELEWDDRYTSWLLNAARVLKETANEMEDYLEMSELPE